MKDYKIYIEQMTMIKITIIDKADTAHLNGAKHSRNISTLITNITPTEVTTSLVYPNQLDTLI